MSLERYQAAAMLRNLAIEAAAEPCLSSTLRGTTAMQMVASGMEVPDKWLPGRFLQRQPDAVRELLKNLISEDISDPDPRILKYLSPGGVWKPKPRKSTFIMPF